MEENTKTKEDKNPAWVGFVKFLMVLIIVVFVFKMCSSSDEESTTTNSEFKPVSEIGYRFLKENRSIGHPSIPNSDLLYRSYAYEITNFDKNNPQCWQDLYDLGESVSTNTDKDANLMTTMVYFFLPSDSLRLQDENNWNITWDESQDSLWIGNYLWLSKNGHKELIKGVNYR